MAIACPIALHPVRLGKPRFKVFTMVDKDWSIVQLVLGFLKLKNFGHRFQALENTSFFEKVLDNVERQSFTLVARRSAKPYFLSNLQ